MKLSNFASLDETLAQTGLANASKLDKKMWEEFTGDWDRVALESEEILDSYLNVDDPDANNNEAKSGARSTEAMQEVKVRLGQRFFRRTVLSNYENRCCICELPIESLLIASHIIPWSQDRGNRLNPQNGLCLCAIHDMAFDRGLIALDEKHRILLSSGLIHLCEHQAINFNFTIFEYQSISLPEKFKPKEEFINYHRQNIFVE